MGTKSEKPKITYLTGRYKGIFQSEGRRGVQFGIDFHDGSGHRRRRIVGPNLKSLIGELIGVLRKAEIGGTLASGEPWKLEPTMILPNECRGALYQTLVPRARPQHIVSDTVRLDF